VTAPAPYAEGARRRRARGDPVRGQGALVAQPGPKPSNAPRSCLRDPYPESQTETRNQGHSTMRDRYAILLAAASLIFVMAATLDYARKGGHTGGMELLWPFLASFPLSIVADWAWSAGLISILPAGLLEESRSSAYVGFLAVTGIVQSLAIWWIVRGKRTPVARESSVIGRAGIGVPTATLIYVGIVVLLALLSLLTMPDEPTEPWVGGDHPDLWPLSFYAAFPTSMLLTSITALFTSAVDYRILVMESLGAGILQAVVVWMTLRQTRRG
jgi:hypothetical protein